jgi:hypothetical protein
VGTLVEQDALRDQRAVGERRQVRPPPVQPAHDLDLPAHDDAQPLPRRGLVEQAGAGVVADALALLDDGRQLGDGHAHRAGGDFQLLNQRFHGRLQKN